MELLDILADGVMAVAVLLVSISQMRLTGRFWELSEKVRQELERREDEAGGRDDE